MRDMLLAQTGLRDVLDRARRADIALVSVGTLGPGATNRRIGLLGDTEAAELLAAGAVGDLLCTFLDRAGRPVDHRLNACSVGLPVADLATLPAAVLASGGAEKIPMVRAALAGGYVNHLITDEGTAEALVG
jgi:DNA-binding transcriptional regulator LsrR (DeoR family)